MHLQPVALAESDHDQKPNDYITPELCFQFHYFAIGKMHFLIRAKALVVFPGGYGTPDELFETLTLIHTRKTKPFPVLIFGREFCQKIINVDPQRIPKHHNQRSRRF